IALFLGQGASLSDAGARAREFVRVALYAAPGLGGGAGPIGHSDVRLDVGGSPRLNQVTLTVNDFAKAVEFYGRLGLKQIVHSVDNGYAPFDTAGGATLSVQWDRGE